MSLTQELGLASATLRTSGVAAADIATTAGLDGSAIDNAANKDLYLSVEAVYTYAVAPTADKTIELHLLYSVDGTNYEDPVARTLITAWSPLADTANYRRLVIGGLSLLPFAFKLRAVNLDTGQTVTLTLNAYTHNEEAVRV